MIESGGVMIEFRSGGVMIELGDVMIDFIGFAAV
jgi:hypothetical protein